MCLTGLNCHLIYNLNYEEYFMPYELFFTNSKYNRVIGKLHLCSRSILFEPKDVKLPLFKIKFSNNICLKQVKSMEKAKLRKLPMAPLKQSMVTNLVFFSKF